MARVGHLDLRAQAEVPSALRTDTPTLVFDRNGSPCSYLRSHASDPARLARGQAHDASVGKEARTVVGNEGTWQAEKESGALSRKIKSQNGLRLLGKALARKNPISRAKSASSRRMSQMQAF